MSCACPCFPWIRACTVNADMDIAALSDHESSDAESVPAKGKGKDKQPPVEVDPTDDDADDSEVGEDE